MDKKRRNELEEKVRHRKCLSLYPWVSFQFRAKTASLGTTPRGEVNGQTLNNF